MDDIRRIKITCRCKHEGILEVPKAVYEAGTSVDLHCPNCDRHFVLQGKKLYPIDEHNGLIGKGIPRIVPKGDKLDMNNLPKGTFPAPASKLVN